MDAGRAAPSHSPDALWWWEGTLWLPAVSPDGKYWFDGKTWVSLTATPRRKISKPGLAALAVGAALLWVFGLLMMGDPPGPDKPIDRPQWVYWLGLTGAGLLMLGALMMTWSALRDWTLRRSKSRQASR